MNCKIHSFTPDGIAARHVRIVAEIHPGIQSFTVVGIPDSAMRETGERVRAAMVNTGFEFPSGQITIRLWPDERRAASTVLDLAMAAALLDASGQLELPERTALVGEVRRDGTISAVPGTLPIAEAARSHYFDRLVVPAANALEVGPVDGVEAVPVEGLEKLRELVSGDWPLPPPRVCADPSEGAPDLADLRGRPELRRALEVAAAGGHGILMVGAPGAGISLAAARFPSILPPLRPDEALDVLRVASATCQISDGRLPVGRPFRAPHHTISEAGLLGGGIPARPGEITRAHRGVLFLDEFDLFRRGVVEALGAPLRKGEVVIGRGGRNMSLPCRFLLVAALRADVLADPRAAIDRLRTRAGSLAEAFDIRIAVAAPTAEEIADPSGESSAVVRERVVAARRHAEVRLGDGVGNGEMGRGDIRRLRLDARATDLLAAHRARSPLGDRGTDPILRVARTIADLDDADAISDRHLEEAISLR